MVAALSGGGGGFERRAKKKRGGAKSIRMRSIRVLMCNLYSVTKGQAAIIALARAMRHRSGNLPPVPGIFPDFPAPIVRNASDVRELMIARLGMPSPHNMAAPLSPIFATPTARIGAHG